MNGKKLAVLIPILFSAVILQGCGSMLMQGLAHTEMAAFKGATKLVGNAWGGGSDSSPEDNWTPVKLQILQGCERAAEEVWSCLNSRNEGSMYLVVSNEEGATDKMNGYVDEVKNTVRKSGYLEVISDADVTLINSGDRKKYIVHEIQVKRI